MMQKVLIGILLSAILSACANYNPMVKPSENQYYTVQSGDNLDSIAFLLEVSPTLLIRVNPTIDPDNLTAGSRLVVPGASAQSQVYNSIQSTTYIWPVSNVDVSSPFGERWGRLHSGIDLRAPRGTPIKASSHGKVIFSGRKNGYGKIIVIAHAGGVETTYAHNSRNLVKVGQRVKRGKVIAKVGRTGNATGNHVHFEIRRRGKAINPKRYLPAIH
ncbi:MAG: murein DD-endopeptidase MepM/ murein hydrolase activator NlpD [Urechidicola sp.]|jgi:murein DD-endopeptidase MepM/ murein hydrolase activator NlpD